MEAISPNWTFLLGTLLWAGTFFILKRYLFQPYGGVISQRERLTLVEEDSPLKELTQKVESLEKRIATQRQKVAEELRGYREERMTAVRAEGETLLRKIREEEEERLRLAEKELSREFEGVEREIPDLLAPLLREFRERLTS
jgi:DNA anti-recombination protein RmuC